MQRLPVLGQLRLQRLVHRLKLPEYTLFALAAVVTGGLAGLTAVGFHNAIEFFRELFFSRSREVIGFLGSLQIILLPAIGMLLQAGMIMLWPSLAARKGVLEVIKAVTAAGYYIPLRVTLFHLIAPAICMGSGGTVGPEGPAAQIGAGVASRFGRALRLSDVRRRIFTAAGAGAAIAAVFNTPLGGVFFALEIVLLNDFQTGTFSALLLASVAASAVSRTLLGNEPAFAITDIAIGPVWHLALYTLLGLCAGVLAVLFLRYSDWLHSRLRPHLKGWRQTAIMTAAGLLVGIAGFFLLDLLGIGYDGINRVLRGETVWQVALALLVLKFLLVPLMLESGGFGGVFAPSLFLGAMLGLLFATGCNLLAPALGLRVEVDAFVLVGMGAMLAAINSIPLAAILILFEMTNDYSFILPLIVGVVASSTIVHLAWKDNIYARKLRRAGYRLQSPRAADLLQGLTVRDLMRREKVDILEEDAPLPQVIRFCANSPRASFYLKNKRGELTGTITMNELRQIITEYESLKQSRLIARDIALPGVVTVAENDELDYVLRLFGSHPLEEFPVVAPHNPREIRGSLQRRDVINAFNKASLQQNLTAGLAGSLRTLATVKHVSVAKGYSLVEKIAPAAFVGKSLEELRVRSRFGVEVILIKPGRDPLQLEEDGAALMPTAGYRIRAGDALVLFGEDENIAALEQM
ncbi:MAG: Voltage-gated ClC-type chloride channel ClcB [bacterium]|nr:Voltage-gated ClC-type chloride channel ClcB [bacterium]